VYNVTTQYVVNVRDIFNELYEKFEKTNIIFSFAIRFFFIISHFFFLVTCIFV